MISCCLQFSVKNVAGNWYCITKQQKQAPLSSSLQSGQAKTFSLGKEDEGHHSESNVFSWEDLQLQLQLQEAT